MQILYCNVLEFLIIAQSQQECCIRFGLKTTQNFLQLVSICQYRLLLIRLS